MSDYDEFREQVMEWCRRRMLSGRDMAGATDRLFREAKKRWPELEALSVRQFNARYPLQVRREHEKAELSKAELSEPAQREMFAREDGSSA